MNIYYQITRSDIHIHSKSLDIKIHLFYLKDKKTSSISSQLHRNILSYTFVIINSHLIQGTTVFFGQKLNRGRWKTQERRIYNFSLNYMNAVIICKIKWIVLKAQELNVYIQYNVSTSTDFLENYIIQYGIKFFYDFSFIYLF